PARPIRRFIYHYIARMFFVSRVWWQGVLEWERGLVGCVVGLVVGGPPSVAAFSGHVPPRLTGSLRSGRDDMVVGGERSVAALRPCAPHRTGSLVHTHLRLGHSSRLA
ncbi:MAG: hypothetical protein WD848_09370, partial [Dehalococcoidia bacterium]